MEKAVLERETHGGHHPHVDVGVDGMKFGMWLFLITELLLFGGLFTVYAAFHSLYLADFKAAHHYINVNIGFVNTLVLITSSFFMAMAVWATQTDRKRLASIFLGLVVLLGLAFLFVKFTFEWPEKFAHGLHPGGKEFMHFVQEGHVGKALFFSLYFTMTGLHALHVIVGVGILAVMLFFALKGRYSSRNYGPVEVAGLYWHLVDVIWIYLFPLFYLIK